MKNMKKLILGMVFLFGMSFSVNANAILEEDSPQSCAAWAWDQADSVPGNWSDWDIWELTDHYYNECMEQ